MSRPATDRMWAFGRPADDLVRGKAECGTGAAAVAFSVMTTSGTTDVTVTPRERRRTVAAGAVVAFVLNTVTVAGPVAALDAG